MNIFLKENVQISSRNAWIVRANSGKEKNDDEETRLGGCTTYDGLAMWNGE
jgi:hypothetical protein